jgi:hypothetical protein
MSVNVWARICGSLSICHCNWLGHSFPHEWFEESSNVCFCRPYWRRIQLTLWRWIVVVREMWYEDLILTIKVAIKTQIGVIAGLRCWWKDAAFYIFERFSGWIIRQRFRRLYTGKSAADTKEGIPFKGICSPQVPHCEVQVGNENRNISHFLSDIGFLMRHELFVVRRRSNWMVRTGWEEARNGGGGKRTSEVETGTIEKAWGSICFSVSFVGIVATIVVVLFPCSMRCANEAAFWLF